MSFRIETIVEDVTVPVDVVVVVVVLVLQTGVYPLEDVNRDFGGGVFGTLES